MTIALLVITDGRRDCIERTLASFDENTTGVSGDRFIYDDSGSWQNERWLRETFPGYTFFRHPKGRQGFSGAIRYAWSTLRRAGGFDWLVHLEDDFTFERSVDWWDLVDILDVRSHLAQMALPRQPWSPEEIAAGGVVAKSPDDFIEHELHGSTWMEHSKFWTTNPSVFSARLIESCVWPEGHESEGHFTARLRDDGRQFGYWGAKDDPPWVWHIGEERRGRGY